MTSLLSLDKKINRSLPINVDRHYNSRSILIENSTLSNNIQNSLRKMPYYVCKVNQIGGNPVIGLVNLINYEDFPSKIIPHEQVYKNKVNDYVQQFIASSVLNNPILLFYKKFSELQCFLSQIIHNLNPIIVQCIEGITYEVFSVNSYEVVVKLQDYLTKITKFYIADGHHRIHALSKIQGQSITTFSQHYLSFIVQEDDLRLGSFNRFIKGIDVNTEFFIKQLRQKYLIEQVSQDTLNCVDNTYIYINDIWYQLDLKKQIYFSKFTQFPSVYIDKFITSLLASHSPLTSKVLYSPGTDRIDDILQFYTQNQCQVAINIPKPSLHDLFSITKKYCIFPPHSTYFTPKLPNDLFIQKINFSPDHTEDFLYDY